MSVCLSVCLFVCLSVCLPVCLSACLCLCLFACFFLPVFSTVSPSLSTILAVSCCELQTQRKSEHHQCCFHGGVLKAFVCTCTMGMLVSFLHRESTDCLILAAVLTCMTLPYYDIVTLDTPFRYFYSLTPLMLQVGLYYILAPTPFLLIGTNYIYISVGLSFKLIYMYTHVTTLLHYTMITTSNFLS